MKLIDVLQAIQAGFIAATIVDLIKAHKRCNELEEHVTQLELDVMMLIQNGNTLDK